MYHSDIIVIGAGPAGLSAAIRARRVRTYNLLTSSVTIISNSSPGGLADWTKVRMTGDGWSYEKGEVISRLMKDVEDFCIPVIQERVTGVEREGDLFRVTTDKGEYTSLAVVVATGMRMTWNEREFFKKGLFGTLKGYRFMEDHFRELCEREQGKTMVFVGTREMDKTVEFFQEINKGRMDVKRVLDSGDNILGYGDGMVVRTRDGDVRGDHVLIDFESYMLSTYTGDMIACDKDRENFIISRGRCAVDEGLFAAGDVTGPPFSLAKAVGEGTTAGLESYRYAYSKKFNKEAPVFAFYPIHKDGKPTYFQIPELEDRFRPKILGGYEIRGGKIVFRECELDHSEFNMALIEMCDGTRNMGELRRELGDVDPVIRALIHGKDLTVEV